VVVSFETLEHIPDQEKFFREIKRVLRAHGLLVISTPNVRVYKHYGAERNPFHIKELDENEFRTILVKHFQNYRLFGQRSVLGSAIAPEPPQFSGSDRQQTFRAVDDSVYSVQAGIGPPTYFVAVAADIELPEITHGLLDDRPYILDLQKRTLDLQKRTARILELEQNLGVAARVRTGFGQQLRVAASTRQGLEQQLRDRRLKIVELQTRLTNVLQELAASRTLANRIYGSMSWRITKPLRFLRKVLEALKGQSVQQIGSLGRSRTSGSRGATAGPNPESATVEKLPAEYVGEPIAVIPPAVSTEPETDVEVLRRSGLFNEQFYRESNPDINCAEISPLEHYFFFGAFEGRCPNPLFDSNYYLTIYPDVAGAGLNPALHYFLYGASEGRDPSPGFDTSIYLEAHPELVARGINPLVHYIQSGANQD
jgi:Methyltransferase domain